MQSLHLFRPYGTRSVSLGSPLGTRTSGDGEEGGTEERQDLQFLVEHSVCRITLQRATRRRIKITCVPLYFRRLPKYIRRILKT